MHFLNLTPHKITILSLEGVRLDERTKTFTSQADRIQVIREFLPADLPLPRAIQEEEIRLVDGIPVARVIESRVVDLPFFRQNTLLIVSDLILAQSGRPDCVAPSKLVRDSDSGIILGALSLRQI